MVKNKPKIRFAGFFFDWERCELGEVLTERNVQHPQNKEYPLVSFTVENGVTPKTDRYEREQLVRGDKSQKKYKATELDDIVYNPANLKFGAIARNKYGKAVFSPIYVTFEINRKIALPMYVERFITRQDFIQYSLQYQQGTVYERQSVSSRDLLSLSIPLPSINEQKVIGKLFDSIDHLITLHQHKLDVTNSLKKTMLSKMFPKGHEDRPELRFVGFDDVWELRTLEDESNNFDGTHQTPKYTDSGVKFVSVENISTLETKKYISREAYDCEYSNKQAEKGDVFMTRIGNVGTSKVIESNEPLAYYVTLALLKPRVIDSYFLTRLISSPKVQRDIWKRTLHIAFPKKINLSDINKVVINVTSLEEQIQIGCFFQSLDNIITLHQRELEKLKLMKQYLLKNMFV